MEMGQSLRNRGAGAQESIGTQEVGLCAQTIVVGIISALAVEQSSRSESDFGDYLKHGNDSALLANLIYVAHEIFIASLGDNSSEEMARASSFMLSALSNLDIKYTVTFMRCYSCFLILSIGQNSYFTHNRRSRNLNLHSSQCSGQCWSLQCTWGHLLVGHMARIMGRVHLSSVGWELVI
jgi:hypothetical protein